MRIRLMLVLIAVCLFPSVASSQTWTPEQKEIWRLEEQQWKMSAAKDASWIETMVPRCSHLENSCARSQYLDRMGEVSHRG